MTTTVNYFWNPGGKPPSLKADIQRHRDQERKLTERITEIEAKREHSDMDKAALRVYRHSLNLLQNSKAQVVSQIGKKK